MKGFETFKPQHILCPVDFSELSDLALHYAVVGAREFNAKLTILHAETLEIPRYFSRTQTDDFMKELAAAKSSVKEDLVEHVSAVLEDIVEAFDLEYEIVDRQPVEAILDMAEKTDAGLIVIGTHGYSGIERFVLGSVAQRVVENTKIPVFLVRQKESEFIDINQPNVTPRLDKILCPCNATSVAELSLKYAISLARRFRSRLTILYSHENDDKMTTDAIRNMMEEWLRKIEVKDIPYHIVIEKGVAAKKIIQHAREKEEDLIVIAARFQSIEKGVFFGKTTDLVIRHASVPVLVTPYFDD